MIEKLINYMNDKNKPYVIFNIDTQDCKQSIKFYKTFPNSKIYIFECNKNTIHLCEKNIGCSYNIYSLDLSKYFISNKVFGNNKNTIYSLLSFSSIALRRFRISFNN